MTNWPLPHCFCQGALGTGVAMRLSASPISYILGAVLSSLSSSNPQASIAVDSMGCCALKWRMNHASPELSSAVSAVLDKIDTFLRDGGYAGTPLRMYLAGGIAVNYYCHQGRHTSDIDAELPPRLLLPFEKLRVQYVAPDGNMAFLYLDANYNPSISLMHEDYVEDAVEWAGIGNERRLIHLHVLSPIDLAISKISRFSEQDRDDILNLASEGLFTADQLQKRATDALAYYIGNTEAVGNGIKIICDKIREERDKKPNAPLRSLNP